MNVSPKAGKLACVWRITDFPRISNSPDTGSAARFAASGLDHILVINERHLRRVLSSYLDYYHRSRTHLSLDKDCPDARPIQPPNCGEVIAIAQVGGLHQRYQRLAA